jgi:hypothetical protein
LPRLLGLERLRADADPAADHPPVAQDGLDDAAHQVDRDGEADALDARVPGDHGRVDADQLAGRVDQRAAGVAEVDGGVGLDEVLEGGHAQPAAAGGADDPGGDRLAETERVADGQDGVADAQPVGAAERHHRQVRQLDGEHGEVRVRIDAHQPRRSLAAVAQLDADLGGPGDDVVVGHDVALPVDDDAGAQAAVHALPVVRPEVAEQLGDVRRQVAHARDAHDPFRVDVDHGRGRAVHRAGVAHGRRVGRGSAFGSAGGGWRRGPLGSRRRPGRAGLHGRRGRRLPLRRRRRAQPGVEQGRGEAERHPG